MLERQETADLCTCFFCIKDAAHGSARMLSEEMTIRIADSSDGGNNAKNNGLAYEDVEGGMHVKFDAKIVASSKKGEFPLDTVAVVYVTNRDGCSFAEVPIDGKTGMMSVDFRMQPLQPGIKLTDRIKFHFFFRDAKDNMLKAISAGHMSMLELADRVKDGAVFKVGSNFNSNVVTMKLMPSDLHSRNLHLGLLELYQRDLIVQSVLTQSPTHLDTIKTLDASVRKGLLSNVSVAEENGGNMFLSVFTAHMMENEGTLYSLYHLDFDGPQNVPPWLCTYALAETLHHNAVTMEQVRAMNLTALTQFIASYAGAAMRSASAAPYTPDLTLSEEFTPGAPMGTMLSEVFKRPFSHPYKLLQKGHGPLITDDCEGLAAFMRDILNHLGFAFTTYADDFKQTDTYVRYNNLMKAYFPKDLFSSMSSQYQNKLMELVMFLGEHIANKTIECKITLVSANAPSMGGDGKPTANTRVQAHACASLVCNHPQFPISVMLEGTACTTDDQYSRVLVLNGRSMLLSEVANSLSTVPPFNTFFNLDPKACRVAFHVTHTKGSFYRTAFCENDAMLGSQIGRAPMQFGVEMEFLADDDIKLYMPVQGKALPPGAYDSLKQYIAARSAEIHTPLVDHSLIRANLRWAPMTPFKGCKELQAGRPYTTCLLHIMAEPGPEMDALLAKAVADSNVFNANPKHAAVGVMRAFASMDGVSKVFHIYSDDTTELEKCLTPPEQSAVVG